VGQVDYVRGALFRANSPEISLTGDNLGNLVALITAENAAVAMPIVDAFEKSMKSAPEGLRSQLESISEEFSKIIENSCEIYLKRKEGIMRISKSYDDLIKMLEPVLERYCKEARSVFRTT
jgi:hypothetical protein